MPVALITGAGSLIGLGIAEALAADGWRVVLTDIESTHIDPAVERLGGGRARALPMDVTDTAAVRRTVARIAAEEGPIDGLVNAAGGMEGLGFPRRRFIETAPREWRKILDVNLFGTLISSRAVLPAMIERGQGAIVSISSTAGLSGRPAASVYAAAKAGVILFTQNVSTECAKHGVRVNAIAAGTARARWKDDPDGTDPPPLGQPATGRDIGDATAFLLSARARHITGACLDVSGGWALH